jgi:hypothetical protein
MPPKTSLTLSVAVDVRTANRALTSQEANAYIGDAACAQCHLAICRMQGRSRHARTLQPVTLSNHGNFYRQNAAVRDPLLGYTYTVAVENGRCVQRGTSAAGGGSLAADYAFGSGRNAHTYMSRVSDGAWVDLRLSYYTRIHRWDYTPMQKPGDRSWKRAAGIDEQGAELVNCLLCHVTVLRSKPGGIDIANSNLGIGCERCHGPGKAHVESIQRVLAAGRSAPGSLVKLEDLKHAGQDRINEICGGCHRTPATAPAGNAKTENGLARFEGAALPRSACYQQSGTLTCVTCHDPHGDSDASAQHNDAKCLGCHTRSAAPETGAPGHTQSHHTVKTCPVNRTDGCVRCHMPAQTIATIPHATYHNHWIKVWSKQRDAL